MVPIPHTVAINCPHSHPRLHTFRFLRFYLLFKQLHVIINTSIVVVCIGMEIHVLKSVCCMIIESYLGYIQIV